MRFLARYHLCPSYSTKVCGSDWMLVYIYGINAPLFGCCATLLYILVVVTSSGILKAKQKLGVTVNSDKLGIIDFTKFSKLTMCSA